MSKIRRFTERTLKSRLAGNTAIMTIGNGLRLLLNMAAFAIVARSMGASEFGAFSAVLAIVMIVGSFSACGAQRLIIRRVARAPDEYPQAFGSALAFLIVGT